MLLQLCNPSSQFVVRSCWPHLAPACMFMRSPLTPNSGRAFAAAKAYSSATPQRTRFFPPHHTLFAALDRWNWHVAVGARRQRQHAWSAPHTPSGHCIPPHNSFLCVLQKALSLIPLGFCQSSTQACRCGSKMLRSSWRRWAAACCPQKNLTGSPLRSVLRCQIASHPCMPCSYKRHTQRSTHFSALLDASAPHPPTPTPLP